MIRLNLGCASRPLEGYINIDMDSIEDIKKRYPNLSIPTILQFMIMISSTFHMKMQQLMK